MQLVTWKIFLAWFILTALYPIILANDIDNTNFQSSSDVIAGQYIIDMTGAAIESLNAHRRTVVEVQ